MYYRRMQHVPFVYQTMRMMRCYVSFLVVIITTVIVLISGLSPTKLAPSANIMLMKPLLLLFILLLLIPLLLLPLLLLLLLLLRQMMLVQLLNRAQSCHLFHLLLSFLFLLSLTLLLLLPLLFLLPLLQFRQVTQTKLCNKKNKFNNCVF